MEDPRPLKYRSLSSRFSIFTGILLLWVVGVTLWWDSRQHTFDWSKGLILCGIVVITAAAISRFTIVLLARPLQLLEAGITSVRKGHLVPIRVSRTGDEIEYLGESFNRMIETLAASQAEIRSYQELLEDRIRQRTEELERAMHSALNASQAKSEFLANMSHELRTPMNGLLGMLDLALDSCATGEQKDQLETAQRCAYSLLALLNDILDLSKIEAGKMMLERIPFEPRALIEDCVKSQAAKALQKRIDLRFEAGPAPQLTLLGDPLRVRQIVANLLSNAIKFTGRGSVLVTLDVSPHADGHATINIQVRDTGPGIPADKITSIFEKFTQADGSITRKYGGSGLGLAITRRLVDMHKVDMRKGDIQVESHVGMGSTFSVTLPCEVAFSVAAKPNTEEPRSDAPHAQPGVRLLLVEDNLVNQKVVLAILRKKGYYIEVANDGREALEKLEASAYDLVLMDIQMPVLDGLEATRIIRQNSRWDHLPVVAMTAHAMNGDRERCLQAGMNAYISKPVQPAHLVSTIERQLASIDRHGAANSTPLDRVLADRLMQDDSVMMKDMLRLFLQIAPERIDRIEAAAARADVATLQNEVKKISVAADQLASSNLREAARRVEQAASRGDFAQVKRDLAALRASVRSLDALTAGQAAAS